jgi:hypothetical protein
MIERLKDGLIRQILAMLDQFVRRRLVLGIRPQDSPKIGARNIQMTRRGAYVAIVPGKRINDRIAVEMAHSQGYQVRACSCSRQPFQPLLKLIVPKLANDNNASTKRGFDARSMFNLPARPMHAEAAAGIQLGDALGCCNSMALLGSDSLRTVDQTRRTNTVAASGCVIKKSKPLRAATAPRANKLHPEAASRKPACPDANPVLDTIVAETDQRCFVAAGYVAAGHQRRHFDHRQVVDRPLHAARKLREKYEAV